MLRSTSLRSQCHCSAYMSSNSYKADQLCPVFRQRRHAQQHPRRRCTCTASTVTDRGASGIDINGSRPTSPRAWQVLLQTLKDEQVPFITPQEAVFAQQRGVPIIDVRPDIDYQVSRIPGSVGVPFMRSITGNSLRQNMRRAGFAFFGIFNGTEFNPSFFEDIEKAVDKKKGAVLVCSIGGILEPLGQGGRQSRSLMAAYELVSKGYKSVSVLKGGFLEWERTDRPVDKQS